MRLTAADIRAIKSTVQSFAPQARVWLFGSRLDDARRGGDIDLAVYAPRLSLIEQLSVKLALYDVLGEQKIDILWVEILPPQDPFAQQVLQHGQEI